jgi:hypothetical protein
LGPKPKLDGILQVGWSQWLLCAGEDLFVERAEDAKGFQIRRHGQKELTRHFWKGFPIGCSRLPKCPTTARNGVVDSIVPYAV